MADDHNVTNLRHPPPVSADGSDGGGGGGGYDNRLYRVEKDLAVLTARVNQALPDLVTKKDISDLKTWILKGVIWGAILIAGGALAIVRLFFMSGA